MPVDGRVQEAERELAYMKLRCAMDDWEFGVGQDLGGHYICMGGMQVSLIRILV